MTDRELRLRQRIDELHDECVDLRGKLVAYRERVKRLQATLRDVRESRDRWRKVARGYEWASKGGRRA